VITLHALAPQCRRSAGTHKTGMGYPDARPGGGHAAIVRMAVDFRRVCDSDRDRVSPARQRWPYLTRPIERTAQSDLRWCVGHNRFRLRLVRWGRWGSLWRIRRELTLQCASRSQPRHRIGLISFCLEVGGSESLDPQDGRSLRHLVPSRRSLRPTPPAKSKHRQVRTLDIHENDELDEAQLVAWVNQASLLPGERM
jgi:hypothetical protein